MINKTCDREVFVKENIGLVRACVNRFNGRGIEYDDLFSAGCMGLVKAVDGFDPQRGVQFSTYAVPVILGEIKRLFRDGGTVKVSRSLKELSLKVTKKREEYFSENGKEPTVSVLAEIFETSPEQIAQAIGAGVPASSLTDVDDEGGGQIDVRIEGPEEKLTERICLSEAIERLEPLDRKLIQLRYFQYLTQMETAKIMGMTQVQVSRREKKILSLLRKFLE